MRPALAGRLERLARPLACGFLDQPHVLEQSEGRIDDAGARRIFAASQFLDRADEVVSVARFISDELQQHEPELAAFEHAPCTPAASAAAAKSLVADVEVERSPMAAPAAAAAHRHQAFRQIDLDMPARAAALPGSHASPPLDAP